MADEDMASDAEIETLMRGLAKHDEAMATARRAIEQAEARIAVITPEWQEADRRETVARVDRACRDQYVAATKARGDGVKLLAVYRAQASALAETLCRLAEIGREIEAANLDLPDDAAPIGGVEPFNGRHATPDIWPTHEVWVSPEGVHHGHAEPGAKPPFHGAMRKMVYAYTPTAGTLGLPHRPLVDRVVLPAVDPNAASYWTGKPHPLAETAALRRFQGVRR